MLKLAHLAKAHKNILIGSLAGIAILVGGAVYAERSGSQNVTTTTDSDVAIPTIEVAVAGATSTTDMSGAGNSWPGELVSLGSVPVQPGREGTIATWNVHIGQQVVAGEVLGALSKSPQMPDTIAMVAEKSGDATMSRANVEAKRTYVAERIKELTALRANTEQSLSASQTLLGGSTGNGTGLTMVTAKKEVVRAILRSTLAKTYPILSGSATFPAKWNSITLIAPIGAQHSALRDQFASVVFSVKTDLDTSGKYPVESGLAYYDLMIKLADASLPDGTSLTDASLVELKTMLHEGQEAFIMAVDEEKKTELMAVDTNKSAFEQLREIDNEIATLTQDLAMAEGDVAAKETAYQEVRNGAQGGSAIVAPKSGTVSAIMKRVGEFVGPGMPVAVITGDAENEYIVRFRIPSNVRKPQIGQEFFITRPGFPQEMPRAKLIGVGNSLDDTGSIMADALLLSPVDWPVGVALRVMAFSDSDTLEIALSSVWWDTKSNPNIWAVTAAGRIYAKQVTLGRTLGEKVEIYSGLVRGDRYIVKPVPEIAEDMLLDEVKVEQRGDELKTTTKPTGHEGMPGMEM